jgi:hypothetical protein
MAQVRKQVYEGVQEMVAAADGAFRAGRRQREDAEVRSDARFIGRRIDGWADVVAKVGDYWPEGLDLVQEMLFELRNATGQARPRSRVRRGRWSSDDGDEIDVDRLRAGQNCWRQTVREERDAPQTLALVFSLSTSCSRAAEEVLWRGAVAIILSDLLEAAGFRVELWAANYVARGYRDGSDAFQAVRLKASESPVDIATLVNGIAGWFFRTVVFQVYHAETAATPTDSLGTPRTIHAELPEVQELAGGARLLVIDGVWDRAEAEAKVREVMSTMS